MDRALISYLKEVIIRAGDIALQARAKGVAVEYKTDNSPVTGADKEISDYIYSNISSLPSKFPVICEERAIVPIDPSGSFWLIDPIDGTRSFIKNKDSFTVNIALIHNRIPILGLIYQPTLEKLYYTDHEFNYHAENRNGLELPLHEQREGFVAIVSSNHCNHKTAEYIEENDFSEVIAIPSSIKLCMVAEGTGDVYPKFGDTMEWDIAAGHAILSAAGGRVTDLDGKDLLYGKPGFTNPNFLASSKRWLEKKVREV